MILTDNITSYLYNCIITLNLYSSLFNQLTLFYYIIDTALVCVDYNAESPWWKNIRSILSQSHNISSALIAALTGRTVTADSIHLNKVGIDLFICYFSCHKVPIRLNTFVSGISLYGI